MDQRAPASSGSKQRRQFRVNGIVQGVGFRPFVYRLATELGLTGFVANDSTGVTIEVEGDPESLRVFEQRFPTELPPRARVTSLETIHGDAAGYTEFRILESTRATSAATLISPDIATCEDCLRELFDPSDRRFRYPFINCTNCGPRYTIVKSIPYDRPLTSMAVFPMCPLCGAEYHDPANRRFHAQPNACPVCGPTLALWDHRSQVFCDDVVQAAVQLLREGKILAIRGIGGFHLAVDARNEEAVEELRLRKGRAEKPFALMAPDLTTIRKYCEVSQDEEHALTDMAKPIVLLRRHNEGRLAPSVAPGQNYLGFMLPYTPLHHLLVQENFEALVMTSGNYSEEPIVIGNDEARERLANLADYFVVHDREILQRCDDSIVRVQAGELRITRRSRGFVPMPVSLSKPTERRILAVGGELKNTIAFSRGNEVFLSQYIGDLDNPSALAFFEQSIEHLGRILEIKPEAIALDLHPEYLSTQWANRQPLPSVSVQHHHAHLVSVMADNGVSDRTIGIILDGTGFGTDGTIWGGEVLVGDAAGFVRHAWLESVPMPGGAQAIRQPWRMAVSYLDRAYGSYLEELALPFLGQTNAAERRAVTQMIARKLNTPMTSSCGRLFDGIAALLDLRQVVSFEAQAAMELEMAADHAEAWREAGYGDALERVSAQGALALSPLVRAVVNDQLEQVPVRCIAARFHHTLVEMFVRAACEARQQHGVNRVGLSGGVYQNTLFFELMLHRLWEENFEVLTHHQVPTNDGGLALGQIVVADVSMRHDMR